MNCLQAREVMLVADPSELAGGHGALAEHLAQCAACRVGAAAILEGNARLAAEAGRRARTHRAKRARRTRRMLAAAGLPIAAGLVAIAMLHHRAAEPAPRVTRTSELPVVRQVSITVERGQTATVLKTADPSVTVIWLSPGVGQ
jgi:hypothetical protein